MTSCSLNNRTSQDYHRCVAKQNVAKAVGEYHKREDEKWDKRIELLEKSCLQAGEEVSTWGSLLSRAWKCLSSPFMCPFNDPAAFIVTVVAPVAIGYFATQGLFHQRGAAPFALAAGLGDGIAPPAERGGNGGLVGEERCGNPTNWNPGPPDGAAPPGGGGSGQLVVAHSGANAALAAHTGQTLGTGSLAAQLVSDITLEEQRALIIAQRLDAMSERLAVVERTQRGLTTIQEPAAMPAPLAVAERERASPVHAPSSRSRTQEEAIWQDRTPSTSAAASRSPTIPSVRGERQAPPATPPMTPVRPRVVTEEEDSLDAAMRGLEHVLNHPEEQMRRTFPRTTQRDLQPPPQPTQRRRVGNHRYPPPPTSREVQEAWVRSLRNPSPPA